MFALLTVYTISDKLFYRLQSVRFRYIVFFILDEMYKSFENVENYSSLIINHHEIFYQSRPSSLNYIFITIIPAFLTGTERFRVLLCKRTFQGQLH